MPLQFRRTRINYKIKNKMRRHLILYAEDNAAMANKLKEVFETNGFSVLWAQNREDAIRLYREHLPDIALLDIKMQREDDGFLIAKKIRETDQHIPILFLTVIDDGDMATKGLHMGGNDYLRKGVSDRELIAKVNSFIQHNPVHPERKQKLVITSDTYIDLIHNQLVSYGHVEDLSPTECTLLQILLLHRNIPQDRQWVIKQVWQEPGEAPIRTNKAACRLRKLFSRDKRLQLIAKRNDSITLFINDV